MITVLDTETTTFQKGNPFARRNRLCYVGAYQLDDSLQRRSVFVGDATEFPVEQYFSDDTSLVVGFHLKWDLHWIRRGFGCVLGTGQRAWCCQLAHFLLNSQGTPYPSLEEVRESHGIKRASTKGSVDYWSRGVDTPDIPREIILEDLKNDVEDTYQVYRKQREHLLSGDARMYNLFRLHCDDLVCLEDMEWNGLNFNAIRAKELSETLGKRITEIEAQLGSHCRGVPVNFDSPEHVSALLYGGVVGETTREIVGFYKTGDKVGQPRYRIKEIEHVLPRLTEPMDGTALKKDGYWSTDESILRQLNSAKPLREMLLERSKLSKELDYLRGLPELIDEMDWRNNSLHSSFNQCVAATGRLSSSRPNIQNLTDSVLQLIETRYEETSMDSGPSSIQETNSG